MKRNMKWLLMAFCMCFAISGATACDNAFNNVKNAFNNVFKKPSEQEQQVAELDLIAEAVELELFEEYELQYTYTGTDALSWTVADSSIATVVDGKLVALKSGETTVTVQVGELSDVCMVKVNGVKSEMLKVSVDESQVTMYPGDTYALMPTVIYGEKALTEGSFSYESSDSAIVSVSSSGVLIAKAVGQANVFVTATVLEKTVGCMVNVSVNMSGSITLNAVQAELYVLAEYEGKTYQNEMQFVATVTEKGTVKSDAEVVWSSSNENVAMVENGRVVAVAVGNTEIKAIYVGEDGNSVEAVSFVTVVPVTYTVETTKDIIKTRVFALDDLQAEITNAYITDGTLNTAVPLSDGVLDFSDVGLVGETTLILDAGNILLNMPVYLWTDAISDADGLAVLQTATDEHYCLETDLDLTDVVWQYQGLEAGETPIVFKGVFDGGEHTIKNFAPINGGLFYTLGNGAKVQNLNLESATIASGNTAVGCLAASVSGGATVVVENITGSIINNGNACGGLFGRIAKNANVTLKNGKLHVYSSSTATTGGALVGCADSAIAMPGEAATVIYTNINICGNKAYEGFDNSAYEAINKNESVKPTLYADVVNIYDILEGGKQIAISETDVVKATLFASSVMEITYDNGFTLSEEQAQGFVGDNFEIMLEKTDGTLSYYAITLQYGQLKLKNENKGVLKYALGGSIVLQEDIDMGGETWTTAASFNGTLDGNGYAIKNLVTSDNDSGYYGLFKNIAGEVKNIAFTNVKLGKNSGVLAGRTMANLTLNNVFIQVTKTTGGRASATVDYSQITGVVVNLTDVVVIMPKNISQEYIFGNGVKGVSTLTNVHCIGISDAGYSYAGSNYINLKESTTIFHTDKISFNLELNEEDTTIALSEFNQTCVEKYYKLNIVKVGQSNVSDLLTLNGDEYLYFTEDVDLAGITWGSNVTFTGTLEGNGHIIKNLTTVSGSGFFKYLAGTVKNVAFTNVTLVAGTAVLCYQGGNATSTVENVFIQVVKTNSSGSNRFGAICERQNNAVAINLTNVVIKMPGTAANEAIYGYTLKGVSSLANVHCIGLPNEDASVQNVGASTYFKGTYALHPTLGEFVTSEKTLTSFLSDCVDTYLCAGIVMISQENVEELLTLKGDEEVILLEDVDLAGITWNSAVTFTGTFDGVGHTIDNLTTVSNSGFFSVLSGTVKNVAFTNVTLVAGTAVLCYRGGTDTTTVNNVFIHVAKTNSSGSNRFGVICERQNNAAAMNLTNVVIKMPGTAANEAIYGYTLKGVSTLTNVHCIGLPNEAASIQNAGTYFSGTYTLHPTLGDFNEAEKTLTTFLNSCVTKYLNK